MKNQLNVSLLFNRRYFSTISGISYAIFLVIFAGIVFVGSAVENRRPIPEIGTLYPIAEVSFILSSTIYIN